MNKPTNSFYSAIDDQLSAIKEGLERDFDERLAPYLDLIQRQANLIRETINVLAELDLSPENVEFIAENWLLTDDWMKVQTLSEELGFDVVDPVLVEDEGLGDELESIEEVEDVEVAPSPAPVETVEEKKPRRSRKQKDESEPS